MQRKPPKELAGNALELILFVVLNTSKQGNIQQINFVGDNVKGF
jgi:hypothetical protein